MFSRQIGQLMGGGLRKLEGQGLIAAGRLGARRFSYNPNATDQAILKAESILKEYRHLGSAGAASRSAARLPARRPSQPMPQGRGVPQPGPSVRRQIGELAQAQLREAARQAASRTQSLSQLILPRLATSMQASTPGARQSSDAIEVAARLYGRPGRGETGAGRLSPEAQQLLQSDELGLLDEERLRVDQTTDNHVASHVASEAQENVQRIEDKLSSALGRELVARSQQILKQDSGAVQQRETRFQEAVRALGPAGREVLLPAQEPGVATSAPSLDELERRRQFQERRHELQTRFRRMTTPTQRDEFLFGPEGLARMNYDEMVLVAHRLRDIGDAETLVILRNTLVDQVESGQCDAEARAQALRFLTDPYQTTIVAQAMTRSIFRDPRAAQALLQTVVGQEQLPPAARAEACAQLAAAQAVQATAARRILHGATGGVYVRDFQRCWGREPEQMRPQDLADLLADTVQSYQQAYLLSEASRPNYLALAARSSMNLANLAGELGDEELQRQATRQAQRDSAQAFLTGIQEGAMSSTDVAKVRGMYEAACVYTAQSLDQPLPYEARLYEQAQKSIPVLEQWLAFLHLPHLQPVGEGDSEAQRQQKAAHNRRELRETRRRVSATAYSLDILADTLYRAAQRPAAQGLRDLSEALDEADANPSAARERLETMAAGSAPALLASLRGRPADLVHIRNIGSMEMGGAVPSHTIGELDQVWARELVEQTPVRDLIGETGYERFERICRTENLDFDQPLTQIHDLETATRVLSTLTRDQFGVDDRGLEILHSRSHQEWDRAGELREVHAGIGQEHMSRADRAVARRLSGGALTNLSAAWLTRFGDCRFTNFCQAILLEQFLKRKRTELALAVTAAEQKQDEEGLAPAEAQAENQAFDALIQLSETKVLTVDVEVFANFDVASKWSPVPTQGGLRKQGRGLVPIEDHTMTLIWDGVTQSLKLRDAFYHQEYQFNQGELVPLSDEQKRDHGLALNQTFYFTPPVTVRGSDDQPISSPVVVRLVDYSPSLVRAGKRVPKKLAQEILHMGLPLAPPGAASGSS